MRRESLDTNALLRLLLNDIPEQTKSARKLIRAAPRRFYVSDVAIAEFAFVLMRHYKLSRGQIAEMIEGLLSIRELDCNRELAARTIELFREHRSLSFEDCYFAASADYMNAAPLWTFDKDLAKKSPLAKLLPQ